MPDDFTTPKAVETVSSKPKKVGASATLTEEDCVALCARIDSVIADLDLGRNNTARDKASSLRQFVENLGIG